MTGPEHYLSAERLQEHARTMVLPPSLFEHPAAELSVEDSAQLGEDRRQSDHIARLPTWLRARAYPPFCTAAAAWCRASGGVQIRTFCVCEPRCGSDPRRRTRSSAPSLLRNRLLRSAIAEPMIRSPGPLPGLKASIEVTVTRFGAPEGCGCLCGLGRLLR
jgi:hypothetical protein